MNNGKNGMGEEPARKLIANKKQFALSLIILSIIAIGTAESSNAAISDTTLNNSKNAANDSTPPVIKMISPSETVTINSTILTISTNENATCRASSVHSLAGDKGYTSMGSESETPSGTMHNWPLFDLENGIHRYYIKCKDRAGNVNDEEYNASFTVDISSIPTQTPTLTPIPTQTSTPTPKPTPTIQESATPFIPLPAVSPPTKVPLDVQLMSTFTAVLSWFTERIYIILMIAFLSIFIILPILDRYYLKPPLPKIKLK